jgi:hypothetical protein
MAMANAILDSFFQLIESNPSMHIIIEARKFMDGIRGCKFLMDLEIDRKIRLLERECIIYEIIVESNVLVNDLEFGCSGNTSGKFMRANLLEYKIQCMGIFGLSKLDKNMARIRDLLKSKNFLLK